MMNAVERKDQKIHMKGFTKVEMFIHLSAEYQRLPNHEEMNVSLHFKIVNMIKQKKKVNSHDDGIRTIRLMEFLLMRRNRPNY